MCFLKLLLRLSLLFKNIIQKSPPQLLESKCDAKNDEKFSNVSPSKNELPDTRGHQEVEKHQGQPGLVRVQGAHPD